MPRHVEDYKNISDIVLEFGGLDLGKQQSTFDRTFMWDYIMLFPSYELARDARMALKKNQRLRSVYQILLGTNLEPATREQYPYRLTIHGPRWKYKIK